MPRSKASKDSKDSKNSLLTATAAPASPSDDPTHKRYFSEEKITAFIQKAWEAYCPKGRQTINFTSAKPALQRCITQLAPVAPAPRDEWYKTVFQNFDTDRDGYISFKAFDDIIQQYFNHHLDRYLKKQDRHFQKQVRASMPILDVSGASTTSSSSAAADAKVTASAAPTPIAPSPSETLSRGHSKTSKEDNVTLASHIMYPSHKAACQVFKDYDFLDIEKLGKGSFGTVQVVQHKKTKQRRACKRIPVTQAEQWALIQQEINLMKTLNHPNILRLHETYHDGSTIYLLMELCEGGQLFDRIVYHYEKARRPITEEQVANWMQQILSATAFCHAKGIVHRDIKPENILFVDNTEKSPLKVIDFGLSSTMDVIRRTQREVVEKKTGVHGFVARVLPRINGRTIVDPSYKRIKMQRAGTPHYMAPEMIDGEYDEKCDVFSAGVLLYQLLSGTHPFFVQGVDNEETVKKKILNDNPPVVGEAWTYVSSDAKKLLRWMLEKQPAKRCTAQEALAHFWFKNMDSPKSGLGTQLIGSVLDGLKNWQNHNQLKQAVLLLMAKQLSEGEITELRKKFMYFDRKGDGTISSTELRSCMQQAGYTIIESEMKRILESLDSTGGSNRIGYNEFISALIAKRCKFEESQLREVFDKFDTDKVGYITNANLRQHLKGTRHGQLTDGQIESIVHEIDQNGDGKVDFDDFLALMQETQIYS